MSHVREKDHWRELAELLGLPPDREPSPAAPSVEAHPSGREGNPAPAEWDEPEAEPVAEDAFEPADHEESEADIQSSQPSPPFKLEATDSEATFTERAEAEPVEPGPDAEETSPDRPRRGRRRGRRGQRGERSQRDTQAPAPDVLPSAGEPGEPLEEIVDADIAEGVDADTPEEERGGFGRGDRRQRVQPERSHDEQEEALKTDDDEFREDAHEDDDDEEIDKLTDWNVPSWTELIGSLYRPER